MNQPAIDPQAVWIRRPLGITHVYGETRLDLLDRMSTQKLKTLSVGTGAATILTTDIGRIIDRLFVYVQAERLIVLTSEHNAPPIINYLRRYVFFQDDFVIEDIGQATAVYALYGSQVSQRLAPLGIDTAALPRHHWREVALGDVTVTLHCTDPIAGEGYFLLVAAEQAKRLAAQLTLADIQPIDETDFEQWRVRAGVPRFGHELTGDYIPLEAGLWEDISFNKGCYIGQEIIARMESRGQLAKKLVQMQVNGTVTVGEVITADNKRVGTLTSVAGGLALGYVKTAALAAQATLQTAHASLQVVNEPVR